MVRLFIGEVAGLSAGLALYAERFPGGLSRHMRVRFNAVVASANSTATFLSPRIRNRRIPRCSFKIPITGSTTAFRRRYTACPLGAANLLPNGAEHSSYQECTSLGGEDAACLGRAGWHRNWSEP